MKLAIRMMVDDVNICSRVMENAKKMGLTMMAQDYFSPIVQHLFIRTDPYKPAAVIFVIFQKPVMVSLDQI